MTQAEQEVAAMRRRVPWWLARPCDSPRFLLFCRVFAVGTALRLMLPDATGHGWVVAVCVVHWCGALLVGVTGSIAGFALCAAATLAGLVFREDQLTKSMFMLAVAASALACFAGSAEGRRARMGAGLANVVRWVTLAVYGFAVFHKLNRDYFDPTVSCANGGLELLFQEFPSGIAPLVAWRGWPILQVGIELGIVALFVARPGAALIVATVMHLPLTIIFAPAFVFVMASGWVCFLSEAQVDVLGRALRARWWVGAVGGAFFGSISRAAFFPGRWATDPDWCLQEIALYMLLVFLVDTSIREPLLLRDRSAWREAIPPSASRVALATTMLVVANGFTPYLGVQFHHAAAMLSNLRIDEGCYNSWVVPEAVRIQDPYVRVDAVRFSADDEKNAPLEAAVTGWLWPKEALWNRREAWCRGREGPLPMAGTFEGRAFSVEDFCAPSGWPFGTMVLPHTRRFQVNLARRCPQRCVH